jgi:hypothetical protein
VQRLKLGELDDFCVPVQFVHEDDVDDAMVALETAARGARATSLPTTI